MADPTAAPEMPGEHTPSTEIAERASITAHAIDVMPLMSDDEIRRSWRVASALAKSQMFKDAKQAEQAFAKILLGRDLGLSPTQAMTGIHIVEGKPELAATTLGAFVRRREGYDYSVRWRLADSQEWVADDDGKPVDGCKVIFTVNGEVRGVSTFTREDSERAGLLNRTSRNGAPSNHKLYPRNMFFARAMSNGVKFHVPEALGGVPVYFEGEIGGQPPERAAEREIATEAPDELRDLIRRAASIDSRAWRENEIVARLPEIGDETYPHVAHALCEEIRAWLAENEPQDAVVVPDAADVPEPGAECQHRWDTDPAWREKAQPVLARYADAEAALEEALASGEGGEAETAARNLVEAVGAELYALGVPAGWYPDSPVERS